jgi:hypothetical protein
MGRGKEESMMSRALQLVVLVVAIGLSSAGAVPAWAEDDDAVALAAALKDTKFTLQDGLTASEREGQPISAQFEIDDGKLQLSIYAVKGDDFAEVVADPKTGAIVKSEKIADTDDLNDAAEQKAAMAKATVSLRAAADTAVKDNAGFRAVSIFPELRDGHAVAEVTLLQGTMAKKVTAKLD